MNCPRKDLELLVQRAAGRLTPDEEAALERHLSECTECREAAEAQRNVWGALDAWSAAPVSADFDQRLYARLAAEDAESRWARLWHAVSHGFSWKASLSFAGACAVLLALMLLRAPLLQHGASASPVSVTAQKTVDIDEVEGALDDVDMLSQLGTAAPARAPEKTNSGS
jgi:anti-sigma factor RsiW